jgi:nicotinate phosphoribosyltransferase
MDTDLYKVTMMQGVLHQFPGAMVAYEFKCRSKGIDLKPVLAEIKKEVQSLCNLRFLPEELDFLRQLPYFKEDFIQFLRLFQLNAEYVDIRIEKGKLAINIEGPWLHTIMFEVPLLAIVSEIYARRYLKQHRIKADYKSARAKLSEKITQVLDEGYGEGSIAFCDFGTRRRFSRKWQHEVVETFKEKLPEHFIGTSNLDLARRLNLKPIGTMAHEWLMAAQALGPRLIDSQKYALEHWVKEYRGDLGIALSDVVGFDAFLKDFDLYFSKIYDGCRHDSGDPVEWGEKLIAHYESYGIDPASKMAVFSDGLTIPRAINLARRFHNRIRTAFGIGTNLTNDMGGLNPKAIQIVIKMTKCNGQPVAKISDSPGKQMCKDKSYLKYLGQVFNLDQIR